MNENKKNEFEKVWCQLSEKQREGILNFFDVDVLESQPAKPEKWTVEKVLEATDSKHNLMVPECGNAMDNEKVKAFAKLLRCAHWANEGELRTGGSNYTVVYAKNGFNIHPNDYTQFSPLSFVSKGAANKFLCISGIEPLLKTFLGIND